MARIITKGQIALEDMATGTSTFTRATSTGGTQTLTQIPISIAGGSLTLLGNTTIGSGVVLNTCTLNSCTLNTSTQASPVITGTPSGAGIPTFTLKKGSGSGNYLSASTSYVDVDATNLAYTVVIPLGWKLAIFASGDVSASTSVVFVSVCLFDTASSAVLVEENVTPGSAAGTNEPFALNYVVNGDGASHTIKLQMKTSNAADSVGMPNNNTTLTPMMVFILSPSN